MQRRRPVKETLSGLVDGMPRQMKKLLFASAKVLAMHFSHSVPTINRILKTHLGFQKFSERWVLDELISGQNG
jgi:DNA-binding MurR/RpiR family transcriptional regulator